MFSLPISKAGTNIFLFLALLCAICGSEPRQRFRAALKQPVAIGAGVWFTILALSALYAPGPGQWASLGTYKALLYPLLIATLLTTLQWRNRGLMAFALAAGLVLLLSWAQLFGLPAPNEAAGSMESYRYTVFKDYTQQGLAFLLLAALCASWAMTATERNRKALLWFVALAAFLNVCFLLQSRTAYMAAVPLLLFWEWRVIAGQKTWQRKAVIGILSVLVIASAFLLAPRMKERVHQAERDVAHYTDKREANAIGIRLELWRRTLPIIAAAPLFGHGLGEWKLEYQRQTEGLANFTAFKMGHPHQEALNILSEQGVVGLALFIALLIALGKYIGSLDRPHRDFYWCLLLIYVTAGLANCILIDFSHRHVFLMVLACIPFTSFESAVPTKKTNGITPARNT